jgi:type IV pilus assembly protein PilZ
VGDVAESFRAFVFLDRKQARKGLSPAELARWKALKRELSRELSGGCDDERADQRGSLRVPVKLRVSFASMGELGQALMTNLSRGGLFVATDRLLEIGTRLTLRLHVEGASKGLEVQAEVVSQDLGPRGDPKRGLGLRFVETEGALRKELDALYERALTAAGPRRL